MPRKGYRMPAVQRGRYLQSTGRDYSEQFRQLFTETEIAEIMKKAYQQQYIVGDWPEPYEGREVYEWAWGLPQSLDSGLLVHFG